MEEFILDELNNKSGNNKARKIKYIINNNCWECTSHNQRYNGYIEIGRNGKKYLHRYIWKLYNNKEIPENMVIMHTCDNRKCINPEHLKLGSYKDNTQDMLKKGRNNFVVRVYNKKEKEMLSLKYSGQGNPNSKLKINDCYEIKKLLLEETNEKWLDKYERISSLYNVKPLIIKKIKAGSHWSSKDLGGSFKEWLKNER